MAVEPVNGVGDRADDDGDIRHTDIPLRIYGSSGVQLRAAMDQ